MKDGTLGLRRRKGMAVKLEQLKVDKDGNIFKVEAGVKGGNLLDKNKKVRLSVEVIRGEFLHAKNSLLPYMVMNYFGSVLKFDIVIE